MMLGTGKAFGPFAFILLLVSCSKQANEWKTRIIWQMSYL